MTRIHILLATTALAAAIPFVSATAQSTGGKCGPETWSTDKMTYVNVPCNAAQPQAAVGTGGPAQSTASATCGPETWSTDKMTYTKAPCNAGDATNVGASSSMTKAEMKAGGAYAYPQPGAPMSAGYAPMQASAGAPMMGDQSCGDLHAVALKDEFGRKYNCRGDRIR